ncbi:hypothetical protein FBUS_11522 [Fasciolopsis buskii]|uniref:Uncharacterized protein n=1 Tax=Fasciolopsis buskii TaxID=27845 RepID=A0A8E0VQ58_9TREM|nr:hypothetical protein FBUS_11522 [Fasciolopsis buski]
MAPHLMDVCRSRERCSPDPRSDEVASRMEGDSIGSSAGATLQSVTDGTASDAHSMTPSKDHLAGPWGRKDSCPSDPTAEMDSPGGRSGKLAFQDLTEMRYEAELKVKT